MAQKLKKFEFTSSRVGQSTYDWGAWLDGSPWKLTEGDDFNCKVQTLLTLARSQAKRRGMVVKAQPVDEGKAVVIQAVPASPEQLKKWAEAENGEAEE